MLTASSYKKLGDVFFQLSDREAAAESYSEAVRIRKEIGLTNTNQPAFNLLKNLGSSLWEQGKKHEASPYLEEAFKLLDKLSHDALRERINNIKRDSTKLRREYENSKRKDGL